jgi:hypothetical protein
MRIPQNAAIIPTLRAAPDPKLLSRPIRLLACFWTGKTARGGFCARRIEQDDPLGPAKPNHLIRNYYGSFSLARQNHAAAGDPCCKAESQYS